MQVSELQEYVIIHIYMHFNQSATSFFYRGNDVYEIRQKGNQKTAQEDKSRVVYQTG